MTVGGFRPAAGLEFAALRHMAGNIRYKPGWRLEVMVPVSQFMNFLPVLQVSAELPHRDDPSKTITVKVVAPVPFALEQVGNDYFYRWAHEIITNFEMHEVDEWFVVDGVRLYDPHAARHVEVPDGLK